MIEIGSRAFDVLCLLVGRPGQVVSHKDFREQIWPKTVVEDVNLRVHITALRKILAKGLPESHGIRNITGRGYSFVGPVIVEKTSDTVSEAPNHRARYEAESCLIGRDDDVGAVTRLLSDKRLVSVVGPGGIGKTAVAFAVMRELFGSPAHVTAVTVELSSVSRGEHVASTVATALGLLHDSEQAIDSIVQFLRQSPHLLLLDCCERVIDAVAELAQAINHLVENVFVLVTSREPMRVPNEWVYRLNPLDVPARPDSKTPELALRYSAVRLFCERAASMQSNDFVLDEGNVDAICHICRSLDGLPLAIELAASQVHILGAAGLLSALDERLDVLTRGHRTAIPRHKTLRATLDWSYDTLSEEDRQILRHASVFRGNFTLVQLAWLLGQEEPAGSRLVSSVASLVDKSLLNAVHRCQSPAFRLPDSTRAYGLRKLRLSCEYDGAAHRHADYYQCLFTEPAVRRSHLASLDPTASEPGIVDDVRAALEWSFSAGGDVRLGLTLTWASAPLFYQLSLCDEYRQRVQQALTFLGLAGDIRAESEFRLQLALAQAEFLTQSLKRGISSRAFQAALTLAERHGHEARQVQVLYGTIVMLTMAGEYNEADLFCQRLYMLSRARAADVPMYHRMQALVDTQRGKASSALQHVELSLSLYGPRTLPRRLSDPTRYDARAALTSLEARILWLLGEVDDAAKVAAESVNEAMSLEHDLSLCCSLASGACPVACWRGDISDLERYLGMLDALSTEFMLVNWRDQASIYAYGLPDRPVPEGAAWWRQFDGLAPSAHETVATVNRRLLTPLAIERARAGKAGWATAEIWRALGEQYLERRTHDIVVAEDLFHQAIAIAKQQGYLSWELRAATSLARLYRRNGHWAKGEDLLCAVLSRFSQGAATSDIRAANAMLAYGPSTQRDNQKHP
ncbi:winged helix-turn-helix domain-containing protein [Paraburkholderia sp. BL25I1N1]|uniref:winged helix-turn-helix domain-containing protein n=1 Tax=Paraburkholderia sp. BL25I1N1 TaxID=1938804 RepID=UPI000D4FBA6C|nr:winged helix-turn-helix domain-containing protein [Paraburkholderia sp. BL25I1N1]PRY05994.1 putative ATPase [Paraburkholderia sp. BL25I1N1]